ncbi:TetR/AcrR family transcriptional regulator [Mucilaginibacter phyllosphaerae]|uniref:AcrR family transcriptional regulator n=1 Tax=Mucilaginibacter phyllosphaerae TaxID=1812349 RepID=A0A4Y8AAP4_9SPHI|nr:TetR/AcrR family transcriptional regulator [Mucilaginibacter phyllosphaerae]MBB3969628.1 AcrR family transcriptional regulator [Mucilaginibacter phyllosphaerae]TEW65015.1 TetR/AcrR family transcriptional regulator [Mucilaginibacter phyllosphaerae]GGH18512.1 TetR family transcriptional regulator [Mucilaginibacter phyllosphaerae]
MRTKAERTKQFILETAAPIFNQKGISGANIDDVLAASRLTKGCLYGHFEGKDDLALQVVEYMLNTNGEKMLLTISQAKTAKAKVFAFLDFYKDPLNTYLKGGCPVFNMAVESDDNFPAVREKTAGVIRRGQELFVAILNQGIKDGEFSKKLDAAVYAFKAVAAVEGAVVMCRSMNTAKPMAGLLKSLKAELESYTI